MIDILIKNGKVLDGSGKKAYKADIAVKDGKISAIGDFSSNDCALEAKIIIDATNAYVCPGFIDIHTHSDMSMPVDPRGMSQIMQGVTSNLGGLCGFSLSPIKEGCGIPITLGSFGIEPTWSDFSSYLEAIDNMELGINLGSFVGHGTLRMTVMEDPIGQPSQEDMKNMQNLLEDCMKKGAFGISTGLEYNPGKASTQAELEALCSVVAKYDGVHATHTRNRDSYYLTALAEHIDITKATGVRLQISHLNPKYGRRDDTVADLLALIKRTNEQGYTVCTDLMPTMWNHTNSIALLPLWAQNLPSDELLALLTSKEGRLKLKDNPSPIWQLAHQDKWDRIYHFGGVKTKEMQGKSIEVIAKEQNISGWDALCGILATEAPHYAVSIVTSNAFSLEDIGLALKEDFSCVGSDGAALAMDGVLAGKIFSRNTYDWVPVFFENFVFCDTPLLTLEEGVAKVTSIPAKQMGIAQRGLLEIGYHADITIVNFDEFKSMTSIEEPCAYAKGVEAVIVNGNLAYTKGDTDIKCHGKALKYKV